jgi:hypothetical protein
LVSPSGDAALGAARMKMRGIVYELRAACTVRF